MLRKSLLLLTFILLIGVGALTVWSQPGGRRHTATEARPLQLVPATENPPGTNHWTIEEHDGHRHIVANGIPNHSVGRFPNRGNPHSIRAQRYSFHLPVDPKPAESITSINFSSRSGPPNMPFGIAVNGVLFDPGTAEFWQGDRSSGWNYEAHGGAVPLGFDENYAHVQPQGAYHYHGIPDRLLKELKFDEKAHSPLVGWAADGFPLYCMIGYTNPKESDSEVKQLRPSFRLKSGERPNGDNGPGGKYDGTFYQDYEYIPDLGDLDECNGRFCTTPEFPNGTYAYFLTKDWPVIPRAFKGTPVRLR